MKYEKMPITPSIINWARRRAGFSLEELSHDFKNIEKWENGEEFPTYSQLERLSDKLKVPIAVFFFPEPPNIPPIEETFRTLGSLQINKIPPRIRLLLRKARAFQLGLEELHQGKNPAPRLITKDLSFKPTDDIIKIADKVRKYIGVTIEEQLSWRDIESAFSNWRKALSDIGVYVFKDKFNSENFSGFCLYDNNFPIIYINNTTAKTRQVFTLFHELAHLIFKTSGIDIIEDEYINELSGIPKKIEVICNKFASTFLVPDDIFDKYLTNLDASESSASELARVFSVSRELIYRKFLDRDLIAKTEYERAARHWATQQRKGASSGGNYYYTKISYLGVEYINIVLQKYHQNIISEEEAADYLDIKPKNLSKLEAYVYGGK